MEQTPTPDVKPPAPASRGTSTAVASPPRKWPVVALLVVISLLLLAVAAVLMCSDGQQTAKHNGPAHDAGVAAVSANDDRGQPPTATTASKTSTTSEKPPSPPTTAAYPPKSPADDDSGELIGGVTVLGSLLDEWRQKTAMPMREGVAAGWTKSRVDPAKMVEAFELLKVKKGFALRAYQFREDVNGNGVVWAMPENAGFPEPKDCPTLANHPFKAPKPAAALADPMEAITGNDEPLSYMAASILLREFSEFGAAGHGCNWSMHVLLENDPWKAASAKDGPPPPDISPGDRSAWKWYEAEPKYWPPQVRMEKDRVKVTFYTYTNLQKQRIFRHTDIYQPGNFHGKSEDKPIAEGPPGRTP